MEFKLPPAGNNGIALRTPLGGHSASDGLELQVIDSDGYNAKQAAAGKPGLKPEQYHGSLYYCVGAKHGFLRPVGEFRPTDERLPIAGNQSDLGPAGQQANVDFHLQTAVDGVADRPLVWPAREIGPCLRGSGETERLFA